jgi:hypothetical protein
MSSTRSTGKISTSSVSNLIDFISKAAPFGAAFEVLRTTFWTTFCEPYKHWGFSAQATCGDSLPREILRPLLSVQYV